MTTRRRPRSARDKQWQLRSAAALAPDATLALATVLDQHPEALHDAAALELLATLVAQRELTTPATINAFFTASYPHGLHDPYLMHGMQAAAERIAAAIAHDELMAVYGDFDVDGVTAVALLMQAITALGGTIQPYIPHREREGYGLNMSAIDDLLAQHVTLLITVDCGITNAAEVAYAQQHGLAVIVTDHHTPPPDLPPALAVVNPKQPGCSYPFKQLVGVGIAFKLVQALMQHCGLRPRNGMRLQDVLDVVALGTVADMGPLQGENRLLVRHGLGILHTSQRPGLQALIRKAGLQQDQITASDIGFMLGPRINAAGRLDDAIRAYELLLAADLATAERLADELNVANRERQKLTSSVFEAAAEAFQAELDTCEAADQLPPRIVVLDDAAYPGGVVGLVAARLVERFARPVVLIARGAEQSRGSARSIAGVNIHDLLTHVQDLFVRFGGHSQAAGFTILTDDLPQLHTRLRALAAERITDAMLVPLLHTDAEVPLSLLSYDLLRVLTLLEPFGQANPQPVLVSRAVLARDVQAIGSEHKHLRLKLAAQPDPATPALDAIAFGLGHLADALQRHPLIDVAYTLDERVWNGTRSLQLNLKDLRSVRATT